MPQSQPQVIAMMPGNVNVPTDNGLFISVNISSDGSPEALAAIPDAVQEIVDMFQAWSGRHPLADVTGQVYDTSLSSVTPANPIPVPDPPGEDPNPDDLLADETPSTVV